MRKLEDKGPEIRISVWLPRKDIWLLYMIDSDVKVEEHRHRKSSRAAIILKILKDHYEPKLLALSK